MFQSVEDVQQQFKNARYIANRRISTVVFLAERMGVRGWIREAMPPRLAPNRSSSLASQANTRHVELWVELMTAWIVGRSACDASSVSGLAAVDSMVGRVGAPSGPFLFHSAASHALARFSLLVSRIAGVFGASSAAGAPRAEASIRPRIRHAVRAVWGTFRTRFC